MPNDDTYRAIMARPLSPKWALFARLTPEYHHLIALVPYGWATGHLMERPAICLWLACSYGLIEAHQ